MMSKIVAFMLGMGVSCNLLSGANILFDASVRASQTHNTTSASNIVDCDENTGWNAGSWALQDIVIEIPNNSKPIYSILLLPIQNPAGNTIHNISVSDSNGNWKQVDTINEYTENGKFITRTFNPPLIGVKKIQVKTVQSPSWVAWAEIQAYSSQKDLSIGCAGDIEAKEDRRKAEQKAYEVRIAKFRKNLQEGDETSSGLIVQIKGNLIKIQTNDSQCSQRDYKGNCENWINTPVEKWIKRSEVYPN